MITLSYTSLTTYETCPLRYKFLYIDHKVEKITYYMDFGDILHKCMVYFYSGNKPPKVKELLNYYEDIWSNDAYEDEAKARYYHDLGLQILRKYHELHSAGYKKPLALEKKFTLDYGNFRITGRIDKIEDLGGGVEITDYKTSLSRRNYDAEKSEQLLLYQIGAEHALGYSVKKLSIYHLPTLTKFSAPRRSENDAKKLLSKIESAVVKILDEDFLPTPGEHCEFCQFASDCPVFVHKFDDSAEGERIKSVVDQIGELSEKKRRLEQRLSALRAELEAYHRKHGGERFYGHAYVITRVVARKIEFDEERVRELLTPLGFWDKVVKLDTKRVEKIMDEIPEATAHEIAKCAKVKESIKYLPKRVEKDT